MTIQKLNQFNDSSSSVEKSKIDGFTGIRVSNDNHSQGVFLFSSKESPRVQNELGDAIAKCLKFRPSSNCFTGYHFTIEFFVDGKCVGKFRRLNSQWSSSCADELTSTISSTFDIMNDVLTFEEKKNQIDALLKSFRKFAFHKALEGPVEREVYVSPVDIFIIGVILFMVIYSVFCS